MVDLIFNDITPVAPITDTKQNLTGKIVPVKVEDILNYEILTMVCPKGQETYRSKTYTIGKIPQLISKKCSISPDMQYPQIVFIDLYTNNRDNVLKYAESNKLCPTLVLNSEMYDYANGICVNGPVTFCYCFSVPVTNYVMNEFVKHLKDVFHSYCSGLYCLDYNVSLKIFKPTNIIISNNIYVLVKGGIVNVKE